MSGLSKESIGFLTSLLKQEHGGTGPVIMRKLISRAYLNFNRQASDNADRLRDRIYNVFKEQFNKDPKCHNLKSIEENKFVEEFLYATDQASLSSKFSDWKTKKHLPGIDSQSIFFGYYDVIPEATDQFNPNDVERLKKSVEAYCSEKKISVTTSDLDAIKLNDVLVPVPRTSKELHPNIEELFKNHLKPVYSILTTHQSFQLYSCESPKDLTAALANKCALINHDQPENDGLYVILEAVNSCLKDMENHIKASAESRDAIFELLAWLLALRAKAIKKAAVRAGNDKQSTQSASDKPNSFIPIQDFKHLLDLSLYVASENQYPTKLKLGSDFSNKPWNLIGENNFLDANLDHTAAVYYNQDHFCMPAGVKEDAKEKEFIKSLISLLDNPHIDDPEAIPNLKNALKHLTGENYAAYLSTQSLDKLIESANRQLKKHRERGNHRYIWFEASDELVTRFVQKLVSSNIDIPFVGWQGFDESGQTFVISDDVAMELVYLLELVGVSHPH